MSKMKEVMVPEAPNMEKQTLQGDFAERIEALETQVREQQEAICWFVSGFRIGRMLPIPNVIRRILDAENERLSR